MKEEVASLLKKALKETGIALDEEEIIRIIGIPPSSELGDYSFPCFSFARILKKNPVQIAFELKTRLEKNKNQEISRIDATNGYVNFFINREEQFKKIILQILKEKDNFGKENIGKGEKILIEHTSINPNASPHLGRSRNALIGDSLVRVSKFLGFKPEVHYYVNDVSKQIAMLVLAKADKLAFEKLLQRYVDISKKIEKSRELEEKVFESLKKFEQGDRETVKKFVKITKTAINGQKKILSRLGINYDYFDYESEFMSFSKDVLEQLKKTGKLFKDSEGRQVLNLQGTKVEGKMKSPMLVLTRSDGTGLYPLRDIAYNIKKMKISENNIVVLGEDQKLYMKQIEEALSLLKIKAPKVVHYSFILLSEGAKRKKMSTRKGEVVLLEDFLDMATKKALGKKDVAISAIKYSILKNNNNKVVNFNLEEALRFEGDTGPYLLYSYARAKSILKKSKAKANGKFEIKNLEEKESELAKKISSFKETVLSSYKMLNPSLIANYSYQLAQIFNEFYHSCPVIGSEKEAFRLALVSAFSQVLKNSLSLLGIETIEKM